MNPKCPECETELEPFTAENFGEEWEILEETTHDDSLTDEEIAERREIDPLGVAVHEGTAFWCPECQEIVLVDELLQAAV